MVGREIGPYKLVRELGKGGMATVYVGVHKDTEQRFAVKIIHGHLCSDKEIQKRFVREIKIAGKLKHPNIVPVHESGKVDGNVYYVMDYIEGESLYDLEQKKGRLPISFVVRVLKDVLAAMDYAHSQKVIHRDIKPENVLLDEQGHAHLADFGIAKPLEGTKLTQTGKSLGTPLYMAPEQVRGLSNIDARIDIYATGILGYEALTGMVPFQGNDAIEIAHKQVHQAPIAIRCYCRVDPNLELMVLKAMEKNPDDRWLTTGAFLQAIKDWETGNPRPIRLVSPVRLEAPPGAFSAILTKAAIFLLVLGLIVGGYFFYTSPTMSLPQLVEEVSSFIGVKKLTAFEKGMVAIKAGDIAQARTHFDLALSKDPSFKESIFKACLKKGRQFYAEEKTDKALAALGYARDQKPSNPMCNFDLGKCYLRKKAFTLAAIQFGATVRALPPTEIPPFLSRHENLFASLPKRDLERVGSDLARVGKRLSALGRVEEAIAVLRKSLHYNGRLQVAHEVLYQIYVKRGDRRRAAYHKKRYEAFFRDR